MAEAYLGEIRLFPFFFVPSGWAACNGQLLNIQQNTALYSLLGATFGGDGITNFALPNLNGRVVVGSGPYPGLPTYQVGQTGGADKVTLTSTQVPPHSHLVLASSGDAESNSPINMFPAAGATGAYSPNATATMNPSMIQPSGATPQAHENRPPYLVLHYCIALEGIYPSRD